MDQFIILGVGQYVINLEEILETRYSSEGRSNGFRIVGFVDSDSGKWGTEMFGHKVLGPPEWLLEQSESFCAASFINPAGRAEIVSKIIGAANLTFPNLIHPSAVVSRKAALGKGNILAQNVVVAPNVSLGDFNHLNYQVCIGHDCSIGSFNTLNGGAHVAGSSRLEDSVFVGPGAVIVDQSHISSRAVVGANAVVRQDVPSGMKAVGVPARLIE